MKDKIFIRGIKRPSGRVVEVEFNETGPQSVQPTNDSEATEVKRGALRTWVTTDDINGSLVHFRSRGIYASLMDDNEFLAFIAKTIGEFGNSVSIEYIAPDQDEPLLVTVDRNKITVKMHTTGDAVPASLETELSGSNNDLKFTAKEAGVDGNDISVEYVAPTDEDIEETTSSTSGNTITVELSGTGVVQATTSDPVNHIDYVSSLPGAAGNESSRYPYLYTGGSQFAYVNSPAWGFAVPNGTDVNDTIDYINSITGYQTPIASLAEGADGGVPAVSHDVSSEKPSGGVDASVSATADDVKTAIEADEDSDTLISVENVTGNNGNGTVAAYGPTNLSGGSNAGEIASTASEVKAAIDAHAGASKLVNVLLQDDSTMFEMSEQNLSGGDDNAIMEGSVELSSV